jgi:hypothetical protein
VLTRARSVDPVLDDLIAAHEFGHTGALVHVELPRNLMIAGVTPGYDDCSDSLDDAQLTTMAGAYGLGPSAALLANSPGPLPAARAPRPLSAWFAPSRLRSLLAGDAQAARAFVERLFHGRAAASAD